MSTRQFLIYILKRIGFGDKWVGWMNWCISSTSFALLVNGPPTNFFPSSRGLHQGDRILPLLLILVVEGLSRMLSTTSQADSISGFFGGTVRFVTLRDFLSSVRR